MWEMYHVHACNHIHTSTHMLSTFTAKNSERETEYEQETRRKQEIDKTTTEENCTCGKYIIYTHAYAFTHPHTC